MSLCRVIKFYFQVELNLNRLLGEQVEYVSMMLQVFASLWYISSYKFRPTVAHATGPRALVSLRTKRNPSGPIGLGRRRTRTQAMKRGARTGDSDRAP